MSIKSALLSIGATLLTTGCYNRYNMPLIWEDAPYPLVQPSIDSATNKIEPTIILSVSDHRHEYVGKKLSGIDYKAELINDNILAETPKFLEERIGTYLRWSGISTITRGSFDSASKSKQTYLYYNVSANIVSPNVRGVLFCHAYGMAQLRGVLINPRTNDTLIDSTYSEVAKDGDPDIPLPWYAAVTIEQAGKLVTSTSIKRISERMAKNIHASQMRTRN